MLETSGFLKVHVAPVFASHAAHKHKAVTAFVNQPQLEIPFPNIYCLSKWIFPFNQFYLSMQNNVKKTSKDICYFYPNKET